MKRKNFHGPANFSRIKESLDKDGKVIFTVSQIADEISKQKHKVNPFDKKYPFIWWYAYELSISIWHKQHSKR